MSCIPIDPVSIILRKFPSIRLTLRIAHDKTPPEKFVKKSLRLSIYGALSLTMLVFFFFARSLPPVQLLFLLAVTVPVSFVLLLLFTIQTPKAAIRKRQRDIDKEVLFAGRYLLIKMDSGTPLVNTLHDASKTYGVSAKYFREIIDDLETGIPIEAALENARTYNSSPKFKRILWQMVTALKTGSEVTNLLKATLKSIATEQNLEIKRYAKKLNSLLLFYMILACVAPSLGLTMLLIMSGFLNLPLGNATLYSILFLLAVIQVTFIVIVRASRPLVNL